MTSYSKTGYFKILGVVAAALLVGDGLWLTFATPLFYRPMMGDLLRPDIQLGAAAAFYALYAVALSYLIVKPSLDKRLSLDKGDLKDLCLRASLFGLTAYGTYDLTALAIIKDWPWALSLIDMVWGMIISLMAALIAYFVLKPKRIG
jgi:uncharacterized membrane protein